MATNRLKVTELDFDQIKENLKNFLRSQSEFQDYDFEGSGMSVLIDLLAYNTHYNAYYLNMVANESFLDTAVIRDSVVSHAKTLGYTPYSNKAAIATANVTVISENAEPGSLTLPRGYQFLSSPIDNIAYNFIVLEDTTVLKANSQYFFENLNIYEGDLVTYNFTQNNLVNPKQIFLLPDDSIDTTTIKVSSIPSSGNNQLTVYNQVEDILDVSSESEVFYLQEKSKGKYEIYFGDNVIGKRLTDGTIVTVSYLVTSGSVVNKANNFVVGSELIDSSDESITNIVIEPVNAASGGAERETIDEIKFNATSQYTTQNRLVTFGDYESYIMKNYPSLDSISVWGGEDEVPPVYGKVFLALKPKENFYLSELEKQRILQDIISPKSIVTVSAEIRDPEYTYLLIRNTIRFAKRRTVLSQDAIRTLIRNATISYNQTNLNKFGAKFIASNLQRNISDVDTNSIVGTEISLRLQKRIKPVIGLSTTYAVNFNNELRRGTITDGLTSTQFDTFDSSGIRRTVKIEEVPNSFTGITEIQVTNPGSNYTSQPTVTITGDGEGAKAIVKLVNRRIESVIITNRGIGYTRAVVTITGGGFGATAIPVLDSRFGLLRTFYNNVDAQKQIVNEEAGTIDYTYGIVTLNNLLVASVNSPDGLIRLNIQSEKTLISSNKNTIISIDDTDPSSITTDIVEE
jgi:hypothetical protein